MEEDIKKVEALINRCKECKLKECIGCEICWSEVQALENLIKGYRELEESKITRERVNDLQEETKRIVDKNYIPISKVKEKIECLNKAIVNANVGDYDFIGFCRIKKQALQELMEDK